MKILRQNTKKKAQQPIFKGKKQCFRVRDWVIENWKIEKKKLKEGYEN